MTESRRDFLLRIAKGAAYTAPVVRTLSAPERLRAQVAASDKMGGMSMGQGGGAGGKGNDAISDFQVGPSAPWSTDP